MPVLLTTLKKVTFADWVFDAIGEEEEDEPEVEATLPEGNVDDRAPVLEDEAVEEGPQQEVPSPWSPVRARAAYPFMYITSCIGILKGYVHWLMLRVTCPPLLMIRTVTTATDSGQKKKLQFCSDATISTPQNRVTPELTRK